MSVDPTKPATMYKGAERQEWQRLQPKPAPPPKPTPSIWPPSEPRFPVVHNPVPRRDDLPVPPTYGGSTPGGPGLSEVLGRKSADLAGGVVKRVWPLQACADLGASMAGAGPRARMWTAILCSLLAGGLAAGSGVEGAVILLALVAGGAFGYVLLTILGSLLGLAAYLTGLAIGLSLIALAIALVIVIVKAMSAQP